MPATLGMVLFIVLILIGMPIAFSALTGAVIGLGTLMGVGKTLNFLGYSLVDSIANVSYAVIFFFVLMGYLIFYANVVDNIFKAARAWLGHLPGGLAITASLACAVFGAASGSSNAAAAMFGRISVPEMLRYNYDPKLATGTVASAGTLAALIPPSALVVVYGILADASIARVLIGGVIPGIIVVSIFMLMIWIRCSVNKKLGTPMPPASWKERFSSLLGIWPVAFIFFLVIFGMYTGIFTPSEAGAVGAFGAFIVGLVNGGLNWTNLLNAFKDSLRISAMIFTIVFCVQLLTYLLAFSGLTNFLSDFIVSLNIPKLGVLIVILIIYLILGCFIGTMGMLTITIPIFAPILFSLGYDPVWFGIIVIIMCECALITPPVGVNVYVVSRVVPEVAVEDIFKGSMPFLLCMLLSLIIFIAFPEVITWLPEKMMGN